MMLTILILLPLVGAVVTAFVPGALARLVGLGFAAATLVAGVVTATRYDVGGGMQLTETHVWIESLGVHYALGVDGLGLLMVLLTVVLVPIVLGASWEEKLPAGRTIGGYFALLLVLQAARRQSAAHGRAGGAGSGSGSKAKAKAKARERERQRVYRAALALPHCTQYKLWRSSLK